MVGHGRSRRREVKGGDGLRESAGRAGVGGQERKVLSARPTPISPEPGRREDVQVNTMAAVHPCSHKKDSQRRVLQLLGGRAEGAQCSSTARSLPSLAPRRAALRRGCAYHCPEEGGIDRARFTELAKRRQAKESAAEE